MGAYVRIIIEIGARDERIHVTSLHPLSGILPETLSLSPFLAFSLHVSLSRFLSLVIALQAPWLVYQVLLSVPVPIDEQEARKRENKNPSLEVIDTRG